MDGEMNVYTFTESRMEDFGIRMDRTYSGISIRDHIAIQAMNGFIASNASWIDPESVASAAYEFADAMIEQSNVNSVKK